MEKLKITSLFWMVLIGSLFFAPDLFGAVDDPPSLVIIDDQPDGGQDVIELRQGQTWTMDVDIYVANLVPLAEVVENEEYSLPAGYLGMRLRYQIGLNNVGIAAIGDFQFHSVENGYPVFITTVYIEVEFQEECEGASINGGAIEVSGFYTLIEENTNKGYPVSSYSAPDDIFSCEVFLETCGFCYQECPPPSYTITFSKNYSFVCYGHGAPSGGLKENPLLTEVFTNEAEVEGTIASDVQGYAYSPSTILDPPSLVIIDDQDDGGTDPLESVEGDTKTIELDENCNGRFIISVYASNLVEAPEGGGKFVLPDGYPEMAIKYKILKQNGVTPPITQFRILFDGFGGGPVLENGHPVYVSEVIITLNFSSRCQISGPTINVEDATYTLLKADDQVPYDILEYSGVDDIFSCEVFKETCGACGPAGFCEIYPPAQTAEIKRDYSLLCNGCSGNGGFRSSEYYDWNSPAAEATLQVSPNPFRHTTKIEYLLQKEGPVEILLFDNTGKRVGQWTEMAAKGLFTKQLELESLNQGIYYGQLISESGTESFRLMKFDF